MYFCLEQITNVISQRKCNLILNIYRMLILCLCIGRKTIALISLKNFLTETCSLPLARTILVKKKKFRPILWPSDNATQFASKWLNSPLFFKPPPKEDGRLCTDRWKLLLVPPISHVILRHYLGDAIWHD